MIETKTHAPSPEELKSMFEHDAIETGDLALLYLGADEEVAKELERVLGDVIGKDPDQYARDVLSVNLAPDDVQPGELAMPYLQGRELQNGQENLPKNVRFIERPTQSGYPLSFMVGVEKKVDGNRLVIGVQAYDVSEGTADYVLSRKVKAGNNGRGEQVRFISFDEKEDPKVVIDRHNNFKLTGK